MSERSGWGFDEVEEPPRTPARSEGRGYKAWGKAVEGSTMLEVRLRPGSGLREQGEILPLNCLVRATYTGSAQTELITLTFTECVVTATGRNLSGLRPALMQGQVDFLQEFIPEQWSEPAAGVSLIKSLRVEDR